LARPNSPILRRISNGIIQGITQGLHSKRYSQHCHAKKPTKNSKMARVFVVSCLSTLAFLTYGDKA
jgi:hypothetical protein